MGTEGTCAVVFQDYGAVPGPSGGIGNVIGMGNVTQGTGKQDVLKGIKAGCCNLYLIGHRGGAGHEGGIVTYPYPEKYDGDPRGHVAVEILPDEILAKQIRRKFERRCRTCVINIVTCGGDKLGQGIKWRRDLANQTGCMVCGSKTINDLGLPILDSFNTIVDKNSGCTQWPHKCEVPSP